MSYKTGTELTEEARAQIQEVSPREVKVMLDSKEDVTFLDVREPNEWNLGRIPGAVHLPRGNLESKLEGMVNRDRKIVVYCARGNRSALAVLTMMQMGYENVSSMSSGFQSWPDVGGSIEE